MLRAAALQGVLLGLLSLQGTAQEIQTVVAATGLTAPVDLQNAGDGSGRLFVVEQQGVIKIVRGGTVVATPFLDIRARVRSGGEQGLLGLAFAPEYAASGRFYVNYTNQAGDTVIALYRVSADPDRADATSETILLTIDQPFSNHNGGALALGPDGYLYIALGDGGSGGDPQGHGQRLNTLLGKILRVDVESVPGEVRIPADNPFVGRAGARGEIWAYGLRNPWRISFDRASGDLWMGDVGQNTYEEINRQAAGSAGGDNYGWRVTEGAHCFSGACNPAAFTLPEAEYDHDLGCSVTGGYVYRGRQSPGLRGTYLYGDFCSGRIWGVRREGGQWVNRLLADTAFGITTFGEDEAGEVYVADTGTGRILRITGAVEPSFSAADVVSAASFETGLTPGSLATVFVHGVRDEEGIAGAESVPLPLELDGVSVRIGGRRVPVLAVANVQGQEQINFQVPFDLGVGATGLVVARDGLDSASAEVIVGELQPAIFTLDGSNAVVVHNASYALVTETDPLRAGEVAFFYATGLGAVSNAPAAGAGGPFEPLALARSPVRVTLGGVACEVLYAGLAPGLVGVYQVNIRVAPATGSGSRELVVGAGSETGPPVIAPVE